MRPRDLFRKELAEDLRSRRSLAVKFLLPLVFLIPALVPSVPSSVKAGMLPLAALFLGVFGSSIGLVRMRESKMLQRLALLPRSYERMMLGYLGANVLMDILQLAVPFVGTLLLLGLGYGSSFLALIGLVSAVVAANGLGAIVAVLAGSSGEVHLYAALAILLIGGASGLFVLGAGAAPLASALSPFSALSQTMLPPGTGPISLTSLGISATLLLLALGLSGRLFLVGGAKGRVRSPER